MGLQQFGVIPFEIRTLKKGHTEQRRTRRFYIAEIVRHRGTVGAWRNRGYLRVLLIFLSTSLQSSGLQDFLKRFLPKLSATRTLRLCRSLCLRHLRDIVFMLSPPCSPPLCVTFTCSRLTLKKGHTEKWRAQRFYIAAIVRHRGTVGAWRNRGYLRVLLMILSTSLQSSGLQDFLKRFYQSYQQHVHYTSVALCAFGTSVR